MTLEQAISKIIDLEGVKIMSEDRFLNYLDDYQAYPNPATKRIIKAMITERYIDRIIGCVETDNYEMQFNEVKDRLINTEGFQSDIVEYVMNCILYAFHKTGNTPVMPTLQENKESAIKKPTKVSINNLDAIEVNGNYLVNFNGSRYELNKGQYDAIKRKQDLPADRLEVWLKAYAEENEKED